MSPGARRAVIAFVVIALCAVGLVAVLLWKPWASSAEVAGQEELAPQLKNSSVVTSALNTITAGFFEDVDSRSLVEAANQGIKRLVEEGASEDEIVARGITAMVDSLDDPWSAYLDPKALTAVESQLTGSFSGVGIVMKSLRNEIVVDGLLPGTPAEASGIQVGDVIAEVDSESTRNLTLTEAQGKIRGPEGTTVRLGMRRGNSSQLIYFDLVRKAINIPVLEQGVPEAGIGLISLADWTEGIQAKLEQALTDVQAQGARGIILDLRGNPGGYMNEAIKAADLFLRSGIIVTSKGRNSSVNQEYRADGKVLCDLPLVILMDRGSASASEIFSGAMQDNARAVVVGEDSFGKSSIQKIFPLPDGSGIKLTIAKYMTPSGTNIDEEGIKPDVVVSNPALGDQDLQKEKALEIMRKMIAGQDWR